jgi:CubicO group peptidase (beta-lactamase class C family)
MLSKKILGLTSTLLLLSISQSVLADHGPQRMFKRKIQPYFSAHETKQMGPFKIDMHSYGQEITHSLPHVDTQKYRHIFHDRFNLAALLRESNEIVFKRFHKGYGIDENTLLHGMSMSKTALAAAIGSLQCNGSIKSLDDEVGSYSKFLKNTPYSKVTIKNVLQMNSGVTPLDRKNYKKANQMAMGLGDYSGKANILLALKLFEKNHRKQGTLHNYHSADPFALSVLITDITGKPASEIFYQNVYKKFSQNGQVHWVSDKKDYTLSQAHLAMKAPDWSNFGQFILDEIRKNTCLGKFFENGKDSAIPTNRKNVGYGYQFWVYEIDGEKMITMTGHGGFFNILSQNKNKVLSIFSVDEAYKAGNLFGDLESVVGEVFQ